MKIQVNLASRPYIELRPILLRLRIFMAVLAVVVIGLVMLVRVYAARLDVAQKQIDKVHNATVKTQNERTQAESRMRKPDNAEVLERAHFLNNLFLRKSFSWTAVMMDLENVLPTGVQVTAIEPQVTQEGDVIIRLRVGGDRDRAVLLVRNLERSKRFLQPRLNGEASQAKEAGMNGRPANPAVPAGVEFDILANYNPLPANEEFHYAKPHLETVANAPVVPAVPRAATLPPARRTVIAPQPVVHPPVQAAPATQRAPRPNGGFMGPGGPNGQGGGRPSPPAFSRDGMRPPPPGQGNGSGQEGQP